MGVKSTYYPPGERLTFNQWQSWLKSQREAMRIARNVEYQMQKRKP